MSGKASKNIFLVVAIIAIALTFLLDALGWKGTRPGDIISGVYLFILAALLFRLQSFERGFLRALWILFTVLLGLESLGAFLRALWPHLG